jgi:acyl-CoA thioester hydrolase
MSGEAPGAAFTWPVRVYYEDTDAGGVVYYANYLRFMERARTEWLRALGFEQDALRERAGILFAVRRAAVEYLRPARFNDLLLVGATLTALGRASLQVAHQVTRDGDSRPLCTADVRLACLEAESLRPAPIPAEVRREIRVDR